MLLDGRPSQLLSWIPFPPHPDFRKSRSSCAKSTSMVLFALANSCTAGVKPARLKAMVCTFQPAPSSGKSFNKSGSLVSSNSCSTSRATASVPHLHSQARISYFDQLIPTTSTCTCRLQ